MGQFGFVLIPDKRTIQESLRLNSEIEGNLLQLDEDYIIPHVTVLQAPIRKTFNHKKVLEEARTYPGFKHELITTTGHVYQEGRYIMWGMENARWLNIFNQALVNVASPHISVPPTTKPFRSPQEERSYLATGYVHNLEAYEPHITLGLVEEENVKLPSPVPGRVTFRQLLFTEHGENGRITRIIDSHALPARWD